MRKRARTEEVEQVEEQVEDQVEDQVEEQMKGLLEEGRRFKDQGDAGKLAQLILSTFGQVEAVSRARAARVVRDLVDLYLEVAATEGALLVGQVVAWAEEQGQVYLRRQLEARLLRHLYDIGNFQAGLAGGARLLKELKRVDDKPLLVEVQLVESSTYLALSNLPRARASLTAARTAASSIYVPPAVQARLHLQSGVLHAAEEDFKTAFSYFYEAYEQFDSEDDANAARALKYMLLCQLMLDLPGEVLAMVTGKLALRYSGAMVEAMRAAALAARDRSLAAFRLAVEAHKEELEGDTVVAQHLQALYSRMLEHNLCRVLEAYSRVQLSHLAAKVGLPREDVERKLSLMILDSKIAAAIDQETGVITVFPERPRAAVGDSVLGTVAAMGAVVDRLYRAASRLGY